MHHCAQHCVTKLHAMLQMMDTRWNSCAWCCRSRSRFYFCNSCTQRCVQQFQGWTHNATFKLRTMFHRVSGPLRWLPIVLLPRVVIELRITWLYFMIDTARRQEVMWNLALGHEKDLWKSIAELCLGNQEHFQSEGTAICQDVIYLSEYFK